MTGTAVKCAMSTRLCFQCLAWSLQNSLEGYICETVSFVVLPGYEALTFDCISQVLR